MNWFRDRTAGPQLQRIARGWSKRSELRKPDEEHELPGSEVDQNERAAATERLRQAKAEDAERDRRS